jgi:hypothetical protein
LNVEREHLAVDTEGVEGGVPQLGRTRTFGGVGPDDEGAHQRIVNETFILD